MAIDQLLVLPHLSQW